METPFRELALAFKGKQSAHQYRKMLVKRIKDIKIDTEETSEYEGNLTNSQKNDTESAIKS